MRTLAVKQRPMLVTRSQWVKEDIPVEEEAYNKCEQNLFPVFKDVELNDHCNIKSL